MVWLLAPFAFCLRVCYGYTMTNTKAPDFLTSFAHALLRASVGVALVGSLLGCTSATLAVPADDLSDATIACLVSKGATSDPTDHAEQLHTTRDALTACWWGR